MKTSFKTFLEARQVTWIGPLGAEDDFGDKLVDVFIDGATRMGPWAIMTPDSWKKYGYPGKLGPGMGQKYQKQPDGKWLKIEG